MTLTELKSYRLGKCEDAYILHLESVILCSECDRPLISLPLNGYATAHALCK